MSLERSLLKQSPLGADVYINGIKKGVSPDLISRVPIGKIKIEARKGIYYGEKMVEVSESTNEVKIILSEMFGNLFIKSSEQDVSVFFDNKYLGELGSGKLDLIWSGSYTITVSGEIYEPYTHKSQVKLKTTEKI